MKKLTEQEKAQAITDFGIEVFHNSANQAMHRLPDTILPAVFMTAIALCINMIRDQYSKEDAQKIAASTVNALILTLGSNGYDISVKLPDDIGKITRFNAATGEVMVQQ